MYVSFESLPGHSRIWIYQASRQLTDVEVENVKHSQQNFCEQWEAHGKPLRTSFKLVYNQFLILAVDQELHSASGCSIDGSVRILKNYAAQWEIDFLNFSLVAFRIDNSIHLVPRTELKHLFAVGRVSASTITFNNLVATKADLEQHWEIAVEKSWMAKYLAKSVLLTKYRFPIFA